MQYLEKFYIFNKKAYLFGIDYKMPYFVLEIVFLRKNFLIFHYPQFTLFMFCVVFLHCV